MGKKRKTTEEFVSEMKNINSNISIIGQYSNAYSKIECLCNVCGTKWEAIPINLLRGKGCPSCAIQNRANKRRKTQKEFVNFVKTKNDKLDVVSEYVNSHTSVKLKCNQCGYEFELKPTKGNKYACPICDGRMYTHDKFVSIVNTYNPNIKILSKYVSCHTRIKCQCLICNTEWDAEARKLLDGSGCPNCARLNHRLSNEDFLSKLHLIHPNIEPLTPYTKSVEKIKVKCLNDGNIWTTTPNSLLSGVGCKKCANSKMKLTHEEFVLRMNSINKDVCIVGKYENYSTPIKYQCKVCGEIHSATPSNLLKGYGCPTCSLSKGEKKCKDFFDLYNISYESQYEFDDLLGINGGNLRFDFAIFEDEKLKCLLEYDGIFHYEKQYDDDGFETLQIHDKLKNKYCEDHGIRLIRIPYWEFDNINTILKENIMKLEAA